MELIRSNGRLENSRFRGVKNRENRANKQAQRIKQLFGVALETSKALARQETFKGFFQNESVEDAEKFLDNWESEVIKTKNRPLI